MSAWEAEVLVEWFRSDSKKPVARRLGISVNVVTTHLEHVCAK